MEKSKTLQNTNLSSSPFIIIIIVASPPRYPVNTYVRVGQRRKDSVVTPLVVQSSFNSSSPFDAQQGYQLGEFLLLLITFRPQQVEQVELWVARRRYSCLASPNLLLPFTFTPIKIQSPVELEWRDSQSSWWTHNLAKVNTRCSVFISDTWHTAADTHSTTRFPSYTHISPSKKSAIKWDVVNKFAHEGEGKAVLFHISEVVVVAVVSEIETGWGVELCSMWDTARPMREEKVEHLCSPQSTDYTHCIVLIREDELWDGLQT